jgi:hypothetical protein
MNCLNMLSNLVWRAICFYISNKNKVMKKVAVVLFLSLLSLGNINAMNGGVILHI